MKNSLSAFSDREIPVGKLPPELLQRFLDMPRRTCPELVTPPGLGEDAAVLRLGRRLVAIATDPITFPTPRPGFFAVHVNANDIAVMGALPRYFTLTIMLPPGATEAQAAGIMSDALEAAEALDLILLGGHTEVTAAVRITVVSVTMFGELLRPEPLQTGAGRPGDAVIQVNCLGIEGTAILASEHREELAAELGAELVERAAGFVFEPGLSVVRPAVFAATRLDVHAMHDPTEGGVATGLREIALASRTGLLVRAPDLLTADETRRICRSLGCDPLGLISSGCLLLTLHERHAAPAVAMLNEAGFPAAHIGALTDSPGQFLLEDADGARRELPHFAVDELATGVV